jgi:hypothetical protein
LHANSILVSGTFGTTVGYYCKLGTYESRITSLVTAVTPVGIGGPGIFNVRWTGAGNFVLNLYPVGPLGARTRVLVVNGDAATRTVSCGTNTRGGTFTIGAGKMIGLEFVFAVANNGVSNVAAWYLVGTSGILTAGTDSGYPV